MASFAFLDNALANFLGTIQTVWYDAITIYGAEILLLLVIVALGINWLAAFSQRDAGRLVDSTAHSLIAAGVLYVIFLHAREWSTAVLDTFIQLAQLITGLSPAALNPSGIISSGITTCILFWKAAAHAMWTLSPISAVEAFICGILVMVSFTAAAIIYILAMIEVWAIMISGMLLIAFATIPWVAATLPTWGLSILSRSMKIFTMLAVLAVGLALAQGWATDMAASSGTISSNISRMLQAIVESLLFAACVYFVPNSLARLVAGSSGSAIGLGEALLASAAAAGAGLAGKAATQSANAGRQGAIAALGTASSVAGTTAGHAAKAVRSMILS